MRSNRHLVSFVIPALISGLLVFSGSQIRAASAVDYRADIQPIFRTSCYSCHQGEKASASLHLDSKTAALAGGISGKAIVSGSSKDSLILKRLLSDDPRVRMPFGGTPLPAQKIELIRAWIDQGAPWPDDERASKHWAYVNPVLPPVPKVGNTGWVRNPIDAFV